MAIKNPGSFIYQVCKTELTFDFQNIFKFSYFGNKTILHVQRELMAWNFVINSGEF